MKSTRHSKAPSSERPAPADELAQATGMCRRDEAFLAAVADVYAKVDEETLQAGPACLGGGACCKFDLTGHRLYVSTGELALLTREPPPASCQPRRLRCPYQVGPQCTARPRRPLGCRVFFCRPSLAQASGERYEYYHALIRGLHDLHGVPYHYVELTCSLGGLSPAGR